MNGKPVLSIRNLTLDFASFHALDAVSLDIGRNEMVALVGESGCGKSLTALGCIGLTPPSATIRGGTVTMGDGNMLDFDERKWNEYRGKRISMIFQEPMTALNPLVKVGRQIAENVAGQASAARRKTLEIMEQVGLPDPGKLYDCYPHQLSGGMRQRIMIAMALINRPDLLIADEPTTALDVTIQAQILDLIIELNRSTGTAVLLISHDLSVVRHLCHRLYIMYAGSIVESGPVDDILASPLHPYTEGLMASIPTIAKRNTKLATIPGSVPTLAKRNTEGCLFQDRCPYRMEICKTVRPEIRACGKNRMVACHLEDRGPCR